MLSSSRLFVYLNLSFFYQDNGNDNDDDKDGDVADDMSDTSPDTMDRVEAATSTNNNKEADDRQSVKPGKKKKGGAKNLGSEVISEDAPFVEVSSSKRKDSVENCDSSSQQQSSKKSSPPPLVNTNASADDSSQLSNRSSKRNKKENATTNDGFIIPKTTVAHARNGTSDTSTNVHDTLKEVINLPPSLKSLSPTSVTSPKRPVKREEGWKEVVRRGPVSSRENSSSNLGTGAGAAKKSQSSDRSSATLSVIQSSERSKKVTVPSNAISRVIGRAGCNINAIREVSGAHIEIEKQGKGQGDRTVLIKGTAESIRQSQQLITALIKEPEKEFNELMAKFRAANAAAKAGTLGSAVSSAVAGTAKAPAAPLTAATSSSLQPKVTRAATTIASSKPSQTAPSSGTLAPVPSTVAWGAINTLIVAASSPKRTVPVSGTKTPPVATSAIPQQLPQQQAQQQLQQQQQAQQQQQQQQLQKSGAVRQLFPESSTAAAAVKKPAPLVPSSAVSGATSKPSVSYTLAGSTATAPTTNAVSTRTTPVVTASSPAPTRPTPQQAAPAPPAAAKAMPDGGKKLAVGSSTPASPSSTNVAQPAAVSQPQPAHPGQPSAVSASSAVATSSALGSSRSGSPSPVQDYSPFNNLFSNVAQQSMWSKEQQKSKNFASVAAAGVVGSLPSKVPPSVATTQPEINTSQPAVNVVDAAKAPGYRGNLTTNGPSHSASDMMMNNMEVPTSLASSAPGTPIPSSGPMIRAPVGSRLHPLTPPPRIGSPPLFNPTPIQPLGPVGTRHIPPQQQTSATSGVPLESIMVPPPSAASLAPGGPSAVRMRAARMQPPHDQPQQHPSQFDGLPMQNFYNLAPPATGPIERPGPAFPLAPGMGGPPR